MNVHNFGKHDKIKKHPQVLNITWQKCVFPKRPPPLSNIPVDGFPVNYPMPRTTIFMIFPANSLESLRIFHPTMTIAGPWKTTTSKPLIEQAVSQTNLSWWCLRWTGKTQVLSTPVGSMGGNFLPMPRPESACSLDPSRQPLAAVQLSVSDLKWSWMKVTFLPYATWGEQNTTVVGTHDSAAFFFAGGPIPSDEETKKAGTQFFQAEVFHHGDLCLPKNTRRIDCNTGQQREDGRPIAPWKQPQETTISRGSLTPGPWVFDASGGMVGEHPRYNAWQGPALLKNIPESKNFQECPETFAKSIIHKYVERFYFDIFPNDNKTRRFCSFFFLESWQRACEWEKGPSSSSQRQKTCRVCSNGLRYCWWFRNPPSTHLAC